MNNSLSSILLLLLAIALLWAAVTNRLGRWLDGLDVALGTKTASSSGTTSPTVAPTALPFFTLPGLNPNAQAGTVTPAALTNAASTALSS